MLSRKLLWKTTINYSKMQIKTNSFSTMATVTLIATGVPTFLYVYKCMMLVAFQNKLIYMGYLPPGSRHMEQPLQKIPSSLDIKEKVIITSDHVQLHGYIAKNKMAKKSGPALIYFQGNAGNMHDRFDVFKVMLDAVPDMTIIAIGYRQYGNSIGGTANEIGLQKDAQAIFKYTLSIIENDDQFIYFYGHSLGGAVAIDLAANLVEHNNHRKVKGIILENTFSSIYDMVCSLYPKYTPYPWIAKYCLWNRWPTNVNLTKLSPATRLLFLSSSNDEIVPSSHMEQLYGIAKTKPFVTTFIHFRKSLHMDIFLKEKKLYQKALNDFII